MCSHTHVATLLTKVTSMCARHGGGPRDREMMEPPSLSSEGSVDTLTQINLTSAGSALWTRTASR